MKKIIKANKGKASAALAAATITATPAFALCGAYSPCSGYHQNTKKGACAAKNKVAHPCHPCKASNPCKAVNPCSPCNPCAAKKTYIFND